MKIASWNVNSIRVRLEHIQNWLKECQPDVLGLQETKCVDEQFPEEAFTEMGYHVVYTGQKTYNGVALICKQTPQEVIAAIPNYDDEAKRFITTVVDDVLIVNVYVPNGAAVDSEKYTYKLNWLNALHAYLAEAIKQYPKCVVMGDFNIAPEDRDVHDPIAWEGHVLVSPPERKALQDICDLGFTDTFRLFEQEEKRFSWWDYRAAGFRRNKGLRIDLVLASEEYAKQCQQSEIDKAPRKLEKPSDHAPVWAAFT